MVLNFELQKRHTASPINNTFDHCKSVVSNVLFLDQQRCAASCYKCKYLGLHPRTVIRNSTGGVQKSVFSQDYQVVLLHAQVWEPGSILISNPISLLAVCYTTLGFLVHSYKLSLPPLIDLGHQGAGSYIYSQSYLSLTINQLHTYLPPPFYRCKIQRQKRFK